MFFGIWDNSESSLLNKWNTACNIKTTFIIIHYRLVFHSLMSAVCKRIMIYIYTVYKAFHYRMRLGSVINVSVLIIAISLSPLEGCITVYLFCCCRRCCFFCDAAVVGLYKCFHSQMFRSTKTRVGLFLHGVILQVIILFYHCRYKYVSGHREISVWTVFSEGDLNSS